MLTCVPMVMIMGFSPFLQAFIMPEFLQGGLELILFGIAIMIGWRVAGRRLFVPVVVLGAVYLSVNGVILPAGMAIVYFAMILYIGYAFSAGGGSEEIYLAASRYFITGISVWGAAAIICSLIGHGTMNDLRIATVVLFVAAVIAAKYLGTKDLIPKGLSKQPSIKTEGRFEATALVFMVLCFLALCAKTNTVLDYDSMWYGLRPEYVLVGEKSFYEDLGYMGFVYYYPKFGELLMLPLSGLTDYSFIMCGYVTVYGISVVVICEYIKRNVFGTDRRLCIAFAAAIACIPAVANISVTAKPDILGFAIVFMAYLFAHEYKATDRIEYLIVSLCALFLCTTTRLTYLLWGGILFVWTVSYAFYSIFVKKSTDSAKPDWKNSLITAISCVITGVGVHYRTFKLTGYIIYPVGVGLWNRLFGTAHRYFLTEFKALSSPLSLQNAVLRWFQFVFDPRDLDHVIMLWTSNLLLLVIIIFLLFGKKSMDRWEAALWVMNFALSLYYIVSMETPDGNYFIYPIVVCSVMLARKIQTEDFLSKTVLGVLLLEILTTAPIMFATHPSWAVGTKGFTKTLFADNFDTVEKNETLYEQSGVKEIADAVRGFSVYDKVIASSSSAEIMFRCPCNLETNYELTYEDNYFSEIGFEDYDDFVEVIKYLNVKALICGNGGGDTFRANAERYIAEYGYEYSLEDENAVMYVLR